MHNKGGRRQEGGREGRTNQWGTETLGDLGKGVGLGREHGVYKMDITGTFRKKSRTLKEVGLGRISGGKKRLWFWMGEGKRWW